MDGQHFEFFLSGFQKLEFGRCSFFLPGRAKDLPAPRYSLSRNYALYITMRNRVDPNDISTYMFEAKNKMRLLFQLIILNFLGS